MSPPAWLLVLVNPVQRKEIKMITQLTAAQIYSAYREIEAGKKLLEDMESEKEKHRFDITEPKLEDAFGKKRNFILGIPSDFGSRTLVDVAPELAMSVIQAHIAKKKALLVELNERAQIELDNAGLQPC